MHISKMNFLSVAIAAIITISACATDTPDQVNGEAQNAVLDAPGAAQTGPDGQR